MVVIADDVRPSVLDRYLEPFRSDNLTIVAPAPSNGTLPGGSGPRFLPFAEESDLQRHLERLGPVDRIVNVRAADGEAHAAMLRRLVYHLVPGGEYAVPIARLSELVPGDTFDTLLHRLEDGAGGEDGVVPRADHELLRATRRVRFQDDWVVLRKRGRHFLKLRDDTANGLLAARGSRTTVEELTTVPGGTFVSGTEVVSHGASRALKGLESTVPTPPLHLRHYRGRIGFVSNSLTFTDDEILPDSFRHHLAPNPSNPRLVGVDKSFGRIPRRLMPTDELPGSYYLLDSENSGHFGHLMTEVISRLWGWDRAKQDAPDLRALFRIRYPGERFPELERTVFTAFGIAPEDITWVDHPVVLDSAYAATPMFHNARPHYVHPGIREVWQRIRAGLDPQEGPSWDRIFVSRRDTLGNRRCLNREDVEAYFDAAGFQVIYPEDYSLRTQAWIFSQVRVIAGFGGSAMFNVLFADRLEDLIVLSHEGYTARNEVLLALPLDVRLHYFWNLPLTAHPRGGWSREAYKSDWWFDMDRHRSDLDALLGTPSS